MKYKIPLFKLNYNDLEINEIIKTLNSKWISLGPKTKEFEIKFSQLINSKYALAVSSGTAALHLAMILSDVKEGNEVICPSLTFVATINAIKYVKAKPVFCDICSTKDLTIDPKKISNLISPRTKCIMVMDYGGFACDLESVLDIARKNNLMVIEDATHSPGAIYKNKYLGTFGEIGCFSFFANKNIATAEGGMLVTKDQNIYERAKLLRSHGMTSLSYDRAKGHQTFYDVVELGYNYRIDDIRSTLGLIQLQKIHSQIDQRNELRNYYIDKLTNLEEVEIPFKNYGNLSTNYIFPLILKNSNLDYREKVRNYLHRKGIQTSVHYPSVHRFLIYNQDKVNLPITEYVSDNEITLPMYEQLTHMEIDYIVDSMKEILIKG